MKKLFAAILFFCLCFVAFCAEVKYIYYDDDFFTEDITGPKKESDKKLKTDFIPWLRQQFYDSSEKETVAKQMLAFDWSMLVKGYTHGGIGAGMSFEKQIGWGCYTFSPAGFVYYYPISRQLRKFYLATGFCWDLVFYFGDKIPEGARASSFSIYPQAGWKFSLPWRFLMDIFVGYKFAFNKNGVYYGNSADILGFGFQWGISFKHYMKKRG